MKKGAANKLKAAPEPRGGKAPVLDVRIRSITLVFDLEATRDGKAAGTLRDERGQPISEVIHEADFDDPFNGLTMAEFVEGVRRKVKENVYNKGTGTGPTAKRRGRRN